MPVSERQLHNDLQKVLARFATNRKTGTRHRLPLSAKFEGRLVSTKFRVFDWEGALASESPSTGKVQH